MLKEAMFHINNGAIWASADKMEQYLIEFHNAQVKGDEVRMNELANNIDQLADISRYVERSQDGNHCS